MAAALAAVLAAGVPGCGPGTAAAGATPEWLRRDPRRCLIPRDLTQRLETHAVRCAERFVAENGYTERAAAVDSTRLVPERGERSVTPAVLDLRYGMLAPDAVLVQCSGGECFVFFEVRTRTHPCRLRTVTMTHVFTRMRMRFGSIADLRCERPPQA